MTVNTEDSFHSERVRSPEFRQETPQLLALNSEVKHPSRRITFGNGNESAIERPVEISRSVHKVPSELRLIINTEGMQKETHITCQLNSETREVQIVSH